MKGLKSIKQFAKSITYWALPTGLYNLVNSYDTRALLYCLNNGMVFLKDNKRFKDLHKKQRCFIMCNGPSISKQDLLPLKNEIVFSVSSGYHHKDYQVIKPMYHCVPQITYGKMTEKDVVLWFTEMNEKLGNAELFLNYTEEELVRNKRLFPYRKVNYVCMGRKFFTWEKKVIDIAKIIPAVQSVPIMCLIIVYGI